MGTLNRITLLGRLGHDPEPRTSSGGKSFVRLSIATDRRHRGADGTLKKDAVWHSVFVWGKNAELCMQHCRRGHSIYVEGHLSSYTSMVDGKKQYQTSIMVDQVQLISSRNSAAQTEVDHIDDLEDIGDLEVQDDRNTEHDLNNSAKDEMPRSYVLN